jgi:hypothetical protein
MENKTEKIRDFLIQAHASRNTTPSERININEYGVRTFKFEKDGFVFLDHHVSNGHIFGQEIVSEKRGELWVPVWTMIFQGTLVPEKKNEVFRFLQAVLQLVNFDTQSLPIRGPKEMIVSSWRYQNTCASKVLADFTGKEIITFDNKEMYTSTYSGKFMNV